MAFGTANYIPPEALKGEGYNLKSDVYSVGSILYNLATFRNLFPAQTEEKVLLLNILGHVNHVP
jgi:serine/threonine protein kinase